MTAKHSGQYSSHRARCWFVLAGGIYWAAAALAVGQGLRGAGSPGASTETPAGDVQQLTRTIDAYFERYWTSQDVQPAPPADDAEFLRRVYLDFAGRIPAVSEVRAFLADAGSGKRGELVERLLAQGVYSRHFANSWADILLCGAGDNAEVRALAPRLETWLRLRFAANLGFDQIAADLLAAPIGPTNRRALTGDALADPSAFFQAADRKPEQLAGNTSRVFLGLQVQCAQCHDHPHAHWTRREFWSFAALFTQFSAPTSDSGDVPLTSDEPGPPGGLRIPDTDQFAPAAFLDGTVPEPAAGESDRVALVRWLTGRQNRWFSAAIVNRVWEQLLGRGLIDPADDLEAAGPNDHAELLTLLAGQFSAARLRLAILAAGDRRHAVVPDVQPARSVAAGGPAPVRPHVLAQNDGRAIIRQPRSSHGAARGALWPRRIFPTSIPCGAPFGRNLPSREEREPKPKQAFCRPWR